MNNLDFTAQTSSFLIYTVSHFNYSFQVKTEMENQRESFEQETANWLSEKEKVSIYLSIYLSTITYLSFELKTPLGEGVRYWRLSHLSIFMYLHICISIYLLLPIYPSSWKLLLSEKENVLQFELSIFVYLSTYLSFHPPITLYLYVYI